MYISYFCMHMIRLVYFFKFFYDTISTHCCYSNIFTETAQNYIQFFLIRFLLFYSYIKFSSIFFINDLFLFLKFSRIFFCHLSLYDIPVNLFKTKSFFFLILLFRTKWSNVIKCSWMIWNWDKSKCYTLKSPVVKKVLAKITQ